MGTTTEVDVCNKALAQVGGRAIASLGDTSVEGIACNREYADARDALLKEFTWGFARKQVDLVIKAGETVEGWAYVYTYPTDCVMPREIFNPTGQSVSAAYRVDVDVPISTGRIEFERYVSADLGTELICTDQVDAILVYTSRVETVALYTTQFTQALVHLLASQLAMPIAKDAQLALTQHQLYQIISSGAMATDANEDYKKPIDHNEFVDSRG